MLQSNVFLTLSVSWIARGISSLAEFDSHDSQFSDDCREKKILNTWNIQTTSTVEMNWKKLFFLEIFNSDAKNGKFVMLVQAYALKSPRNSKLYQQDMLAKAFMDCFKL